MALVCCCLCCLAGCSATNLDKYAKNLSTYRIEAGFDHCDMSVSAVESVEFFNATGGEVEELRFHLYPNAYREGVKNKPVSPAKSAKAYPNGYDYGGIEIEYATQGEEDLPFEIGGEEQNILILPLAQPVKDGQKTTVKISFETTLANVRHRLGYAENTVNLNHWFPLLCKYDEEEGWLQDVYCSTGDPFVADVANFEVGLTVAQDYQVAVGADTVLCEQDEEKNSVRRLYQAKAVRDFSIVMSKKFNILTQRTGEVDIAYFFVDDQNPQEILDLAVRAVEYYGESFGKYPYGTLSVVQSDFCEGGMEYPRLAMVTVGMERKFYKQAVAHEIAHQWWCCVVGNDQIRNAWMDEGLAEYSTHLFFCDNDFGIDAKSELRASKQALHDFLEITKNYFKEVDTSLTRTLREYRSETEYAYLNYVKSMVMFDDFKQLMGKKKFLKALRLYYADNAFSVATPQDLADSFSKAYGADFSSLLEGYVNGEEKTVA